MTSLNRQDRDLHYDDGTHRVTPPSTSGHQIDLWDRRLRRHMERHAAEQGCNKETTA